MIIAVYLALRFEWKMSLSTLAALVHDLIITIGVYALFQIEVSPSSVVALLTILGYSLYDTVVVFDKIKENTVNLASSKLSYSDNVNKSLNEVLLRSINTSLSALIPVVSLLVVGSVIFGALAIRDFAMALFVGPPRRVPTRRSSWPPRSSRWWKEKEPTSRRLPRAPGPPGPTRSSPPPAARPSPERPPARPARRARRLIGSTAGVFDGDDDDADGGRPAGRPSTRWSCPRQRPDRARPARPRGKKRRR